MIIRRRGSSSCWGHALPAGRLVELLWDDRPPVSAAANIRTYAARLRAALADPGRPGGSRLVRRAPGYLVDARPEELDRGRLVERGTHDELLRAGKHYAELFNLQAAGYRTVPEDSWNADSRSRCNTLPELG